MRANTHSHFSACPPFLISRITLARSPALPASSVTSHLPAAGIILVSPYTSVKDLVSQHAGILTSWLTAELANLYPSDE